MKNSIKNILALGLTLSLLLIATVPAFAATLKAPQLVSAKATNYHSIKVQWKTVSGAKGYEIMRKNGSSGFKMIKRLSGSNRKTFTDTTVNTGTRYTYSVRAYTTNSNKTVRSTYNRSGVSATAKLATPSISKLTQNSAHRVKATWKRVTGANGYQLYRSEKRSGGFKLAKTITNGSTVSSTDTTKLTVGKTYYYKLRAFRTVGSKRSYSPFSTVRSIAIKRSQPSSIKLNKTALTLTVGETSTLTVTPSPSDANLSGLLWSSDNATVASVDAGKVVANSPGSTVITATVNGKSAKCTVTVTAPQTEPEVPEEKSKTLVAYYSAQNHTKAVAGYIADATGGDLFELIPTNPYTEADLDWTDQNSRVNKEHEDESLRAVELEKSVPDNWESYDTIFVGYPIWWGIAAWPVNGFISANDFSGKTVIPFCTSSSSGLGESGELLAKAAGTGNWQEGKRFPSSTSESTVKEWVESLNLPTKDNNSNNNEVTEPNVPDIAQKGYTTAVPAAYTTAATQQGSVVRLDYDSKDYAGSGADIKKTAFVYKPYGYDEPGNEKRYDILYLMHGWGGRAGEYFSFVSIKNMFDNLIQKGDIPPILIVSATFYNENSSTDFSGSIREFREFHQDFENNLMPTVEGKFRTYANSTSQEDLKASRDHRAFGGFSLGSVTTWLEFCHDYDYIRYFLPMSGSSWYYGTYGDFQTEKNVDYIEQLVKDNNLDERGYFIYHTTGTQDAVKSQSLMQAEEMLERNDVFTPDHYVFYQKDGGYHDFNAVQEYLYNALPLFFPGVKEAKEASVSEPYTTDTAISSVSNDPVFGDYGRLIFPVNSNYYSGDTLGNLRLTWYNYIDPNKTVEIANYMKDHAEKGDTIFYDIYTDEEKAADPSKANTGLFFFKGNPGERFAVCNAGGGFAYVGAMQDSFPHALELSKMGYNAFALIYRPGWDTACEDLARAISFIFANADELEVNTDCYSLWGGSAGGRMAASLGTYGPAYFGGDNLPRPGTCVIQYTGHSQYSPNDPPTYSCVGTSDGIANWRTMQNRLNAMSSYGIPTEFHVYEGLPHGFGLGTGTVAEGWINDAVAFWREQMK